jgi:hypothetical protein
MPVGRAEQPGARATYQWICLAQSPQISPPGISDAPARHFWCASPTFLVRGPAFLVRWPGGAGLSGLGLRQNSRCSNLSEL